MPKQKTPKKPTTDQEIALVVRETEEMVDDLAPIPDKIRTLKMTSDENYSKLMEHARVVREMQRQIESKQKWATEGLKEAMKRVKSLFVPMISSCTSILSLVDQKQREYDRWQEQVLAEEQARLQKEAEEEQKRLERNARRRAARRDDPEEAEMILRNVPEVEAREAEKPEAPKVDGVSRAMIWDYEILDESEVPEFSPHSDLPLWARSFNRTALLEVRKVLMEDESKPQPIEGVRFFRKPVTRYERL